MNNRNELIRSTSHASQDDTERRSEQRYDVADGYTDIVIPASGAPSSAQILDVSRSGLRVRLKMRLPRESEITVYLKDMSVEGRVCYCKPNEVGTFDVGVLINELKPN